MYHITLPQKKKRDSITHASNPTTMGSQKHNHPQHTYNPTTTYHINTTNP
ncbi:hypothetical protein HYC85_003425 [Camellia sinensis]|uniref:Uncharacterized protein n=1 Tax=Camellia sinensis TaxID=4442 RepID=A0A7J7ICG5_CAMSI|nr:hypothetical protein HYC85_003425 [Camellia sinensis]